MPGGPIETIFSLIGYSTSHESTIVPYTKCLEKVGRVGPHRSLKTFAIGSIILIEEIAVYSDVVQTGLHSWFAKCL